jgi:hypothetical protein
MRYVFRNILAVSRTARAFGKDWIDWVSRIDWLGGDDNFGNVMIIYLSLRFAVKEGMGQLPLG